MNTPEYPRSIKRYLQKIRKFELSVEHPYDIKDVIRYKITVDKNIIYPEIFVNKEWHKFKLGGKLQTCVVPRMIGNITNNKIKRIKDDWYKWFDKFINKNDLKMIKDDTKESKSTDAVLVSNEDFSEQDI